MVSPSKEARDEDARQYGASQDEIDHLFPNRPRNHGQTFRFSELYLSLFNPLSECRRGGHSSGSAKISPHERRRKIIARFIDRWRSQVGNDFYPALRLILPDKDRERGTYGLKESNIGKLLVKVLMIDRNSEDGQALLRWKLPGGGARGGGGGGAGFRGPPSHTAGDFASRCREVLKRREMRSEPGDLTVADVNEQLDRLAAASGEAENLAVIRHLHSRMNSDEMAWAISIILRQLRIGATEKTILDVWHPSAEPLFTVSSSLRRVCWELPDREVVLPEADAGLALMQCFQPQLAQFQISVSFEKMVRRLVGGEEAGGPGGGEGGAGAGGEGGGGSQGGAAVEGSDGGGGREFWIEEKLDGERMQMHMAEDPDAPGGRRFGWWSRKGKEYTYLYGRGLRDPDSAITRHLDDDCFAAGVRDLILDGEMVTWDPKTGKLVAFGTLKTAAISERVAASQDLAAFGHAGAGAGGGDEPRPVFRVFDIVYLNGTDLTRYTLRDRRRALAGAVRGAPSRLEVHPYVATTSADEIEPQLRTIVAESSEGLVLKNPSSPYRLGRRADDWLKVKPEYMAEFGENLDCVIVGGYYGSGRRGGSLSSFLCGLRAGQNQAVAGAAATPAGSAAGSSPEKCWSFCKVGGGLRAEDYAEIGRLTEGRWRDWDLRRPPAHYLELAGGSGPTGRQLERPDVWIRPSESVVIEIKATSVGPSNQFALGKTLRFPRFRRIRPDKRWDQGLDIDEFELLARNAVEEREQKTMEIEDRRRRAKRVRRERVIVGVDPDAAPAAAAPGPSDSTAVFAGLEFCVLTGAGRRLTKGQLEAIIRRNGGAVAQRAVPLSAQIIVAEKLVVKAASLIKAGDVDMVKPKWVTDCVAQGSVLPYEEAHLFHATAATRAAADASTDRYGDSYARDVSAAELRDILVDMPKLERLNCGPPDRRVLLDGLVQDGGVLPPTHGLMFDQCAVHFVNADPRSVVRLVRLRNYVRFGGGVITPELEPAVTTHVVVVLPSGAGAGGDMQVVVADAVAAAKAAGGAAGSTGPVVVVGSWVETCWREGARVEEDDFEAG